MLEFQSRIVGGDRDNRKIVRSTYTDIMSYTDKIGIIENFVNQ